MKTSINIDERVDSIVHVATKAETVKDAAGLVIKGFARALIDFEDIDVASGYRPDTLQRRLAEAIDARAEEISEAIAKNTIADDTPEGPADIAQDRASEPTNTTAEPQLIGTDPDSEPALDSTGENPDNGG